MAQLIVRNLDDDVKAKLQRRAKKHGHSTEQEVRSILRDAVKGEDRSEIPLGTRLAARFSGIGLDKAIPKMRGVIRPATFKK